VKQTLQILEAQGNTNRLTITPDRVTVKTAKGMSPVRRKQLMAFVEYVVEQFVVVNKVWRGAIKFELAGIQMASVSMKSDNPKTPCRRYEGTV